jgi:multicomponent Na+:H+ antiporter subunit D
MNNLVVMPLIIPLITGLVLVIFRRQIRLHRLMSLLATLSVSVVAILLMNQVVIDGPQTLQLGNWEAPFGISLVADMLSGILVLVTGIVVSCCLLYAFFSIGRDRELNYFYPLVLFLLTGINGSFLTGDIFNLFVFLTLRIANEGVHFLPFLRLTQCLRFLLLHLHLTLLHLTLPLTLLLPLLRQALELTSLSPLNQVHPFHQVLAPWLFPQHHLHPL